MILAIVAVFLISTGLSLSFGNKSGLIETVEFCNDHSHSVRLFFRVQYQGLEYAMLVDEIPSQKCVKQDAVVNGKYLVRSFASDGTVFAKTVGEVFDGNLWFF